MSHSLDRRLRLFVLIALLPATLSAAASRVSASPDRDEGDVRVVNTPTVKLSHVDDAVLRELRRPQLTPAFLRAKRRYLITFNPGEPPRNFVVVAVEDDGWIAVVVSDIAQPEFVTVNDPRDVLWINVTRAFSFKEVIPQQP